MQRADGEGTRQDGDMSMCAVVHGTRVAMHAAAQTPRVRSVWQKEACAILGSGDRCRTYYTWQTLHPPGGSRTSEISREIVSIYMGLGHSKAW